MLESLQIHHELEGGDITHKHPGLVEASAIMSEAFREADKGGTTLEERIAKRMIGTKQTKLASVDDASFSSLRDQIRVFVERDLPIPMITATGAMKDKAGTVEDQRPDVAELTSLAMMQSLGEAVGEIYSPGVRMQLIQEDTGDKYLNESNEHIPAFVDIYTQRLETLVSAIACLKGIILPQRESALLQSNGIHSVKDFSDAANEYYRLFLEYLHESDDSFEPQWQDLKSYQELVDIGWLGTISQEMRDFYYERAALIYDTTDRSKHIDNLARFFAAVLLRKKCNVTSNVHSISSDYKDIENAIPIRFSFAAPTPGMPTKGGRVFLRSMPRKICSKGIPYWCADGLMVDRTAEGNAIRYPGIRGRNDPLYQNMKYIRGRMHIEDAGISEIDSGLLTL